jgi:mannose-1-phosphate guanylyltransferase
VKAFLLAAGLGTRLRPITDTLPKCLVPICGKPLLGWWIDLFEKYNITEVLINLHYLHEQVVEYVQNHPTKVKFHFFYEEKLLGSGGTLRHNYWFVEKEENFLVFYSDNLTNLNIGRFMDFHISHNHPFTMGLFRTDVPKSKGIAELDVHGTIISFIEKPKEPRSNLANAGVYAAHPEIIKEIPDKELADIGFDLLPRLQNRMAGIELEDYLADIGTIESLNKAQIEWQKIINHRKSL